MPKDVSRQIWSVSTLSCLVTIAVYACLAPLWPLVPLSSRNETPCTDDLQGQPENSTVGDEINPRPDFYESQYRQWLDEGQKAEAEGKLAEAVRCYSWAMSYREDSDLEQRVKAMEQKLREHGEFREMWTSAEKLERQGEFGEALDSYSNLAARYPSSQPLQKKIRVCRLLLKMEEEQRQLMDLADGLFTEGKWDKAIHHYRKIRDLYQKWPEDKKESQQLSKRYRQAIHTLAPLEQNWPVIQNYLREKRTILALRYAKKISGLPGPGIISELEMVLREQMTWIPPGNFIMGSDSSDKDESPQREVALGGYYIDRYEVTNRDYLFFVKSTGYRLPDFGDDPVPSSRESHPVIGVSWEDAANYARWAGKRLPTEAEWEKAARGMNGSIYPWGNGFYPGYCNSLESGLSDSAQIGTFGEDRSPFGCFDMAGNVCEWTASEYTPYPGSSEPLIRRPKYRVARGGSWYNPAEALRSSNRYPHFENTRLKSLGFRCAYSDKE